MKKFLLFLIPVVLLAAITIILFPYRTSKEPLTLKKADLQTEMRKRIINMIQEKSEAKGQKPSHTKPRPVIAKKEKGPPHRVMTTSLRKEIKRSIDQGKKDIRIVLNTTEDKDEVSNSVINAGGRIIRKRPGFMAVEVPVDKAEKLIIENSSIGFARLPFKFYPTGKVTEGVNLTGANIFNDTIYRGAGIKVAVVDVGFKGLTAAISAGELPANVITWDFSGSGLQTEYYHGTACAEIIHDMAPDAELHLVKLGDEIGGYEVIDYLIDNNIDIVSLSIGTFGTGPGDGTGPLNEAFDELRDAGILVITSAGNYGNYTYEEDGITLTFGSHWEGTFNDYDNDEWHEFIKYDSSSNYNVLFALPDQDDDGKPSTSEVSILMRWDDWPGSNIDYDMYLYEFDYENMEVGDFVTSSEYWQTGTQEPVEYISLNIPDAETRGRFYALYVARYDTQTPKGVKLEIYLGGTSEFVPFVNYNGSLNISALATSSSSLSEPADAASVMAVGAIDRTQWQTGPQEEYSSQGPTNDWNGSPARIKPDIMGPDAVTTYTHATFKDNRPFLGTSAAAPHVAGVAALMLSIDPEMTLQELKGYIEENAFDMGTFGKDNIYGYGRSVIKDKDYDSMPDIWEKLFGQNPDINDASLDPDGDGLANLMEYRFGTNPKKADTDGDGMPDGWEVQYGLNSLVNDADLDLDGDGFSNLKEYQEGTLPNDRRSRPRRIAMPWLPLLLGD
ncbi:MAG: S8 family serine peptidase [Desulfatiglans sp.]|nr:S8 family serine peptidase [Desulfatiglans sp.]